MLALLIAAGDKLLPESIFTLIEASADSIPWTALLTSPTTAPQKHMSASSGMRQTGTHAYTFSKFQNFIVHLIRVLTVAPILAGAVQKKE